jgi:hypothetical protein
LDIGIVKEPPATSSDLIYSFGSFELSAAANTLTRDGELVRTQYLPFQMLLFLLERAGQMVTKEELRERLWGGDTFVEVDQNLYVIVSKLSCSPTPQGNLASFRPSRAVAIGSSVPWHIARTFFFRPHRKHLPVRFSLRLKFPASCFKSPLSRKSRRPCSPPL